MFLGVHFVVIAGRLLGLGSGLLGVLVVGLDVLGHVFAFLVKTFRVEFEENSIWDKTITAHLKVRCNYFQKF